MMDRIAAGYDNQRRFAANASHELRTPLAVQRTLVEVGMSAPLTDEQRALLSDQLLTTNQRSERLIEGLLVLAEVEQTSLRLTPVRLDQLAESVVGAYQERAAAMGVTLTCTSTPTTVAGEQVLIERLLVNLVQNGLLYNHTNDGRVHVEVGAHKLSVTNSGLLVAAEDVGNLFEPFRRGTRERLDHGGGAGLGLTICRAVATAHAAAIVAAPGPDGGLAITVEFRGA